MSGYSIAGALGGYGYDQYSAPSAWDEETNYNKVARTERPRSFRARVDAKKREMRLAQQTAAAEQQSEMKKENQDAPKGPKSDSKCQCMECAPHLYRSHAHESHDKPHETHGCQCQDCKKGSCRTSIFNHMTQQDCFIIFVIVIIGIVLYCMYCTMCRLNDVLSRLGHTSVVGSAGLTLNTPAQNS